LSNLYNTKIINKTNKEIPVELRVENVNGEIKLIGKSTLKLKQEAVNEAEFFIVVDKKDIRNRNTKLIIGLYQNGEKVGTVKTNFLGPFI